MYFNHIPITFSWLLQLYLLNSFHTLQHVVFRCYLADSIWNCSNHKDYFCCFLTVSPSLVVTWGLCVGVGSKRISLRDYHCTLHAHTQTHTCEYTHTHVYRQFRLNWTTIEFLSMISPTPHLYTSTHPEQKGFKRCHTHHCIPERVRRPPRKTWEDHNISNFISCCRYCNTAWML